MTVNEISFFTPLLAIVFGLLSFASPCCLPLLPAYLGMIAGSSGTAGAAGVGRRGLLWNGLGFVAGLSLVFALLGATASALGFLLLRGRPLLIEAGGFLIVVFGLHMLGALRLGWLAGAHLLPRRPEPLRGARGVGRQTSAVVRRRVRRRGAAHSAPGVSGSDQSLAAA